jgi:hypothetical protein
MLRRTVEVLGISGAGEQRDPIAPYGSAHRPRLVRFP